MAKRIIWFTLVLAMFAALTAACTSSSSSTTPTSQPSAATQPATQPSTASQQPATVPSGPKQEFTCVISVYAGWMPHYWAFEQGKVVQKWADKSNIKINYVHADYIPSVEAYVAGQADCVVMTNMEALNMAAAAGVDTTAVIIGDYSDGNDAVITRNNLGLCDLKGKEVRIVELSVSQYLLDRGLDTMCKGKTTERDLKLMNTSDSDIASVFISDKSHPAVVTWNPMVLDVLGQVPGATRAYDSSKIPGEILDIMFVRTDTLNKHPELGKALAGAWYETMALMRGQGKATQDALSYMAQRSGTTLDSYNQQLKTTHFYATPADAQAFTRSDQLVATMDLVRRFSFDHGLWQDFKVNNIDAIGISFPGGKTLGDPNNVKLRFTDEYYKVGQ